MSFGGDLKLDESNPDIYLQCLLDGVLGVVDPNHKPSSVLQEMAINQRKDASDPAAKEFLKIKRNQTESKENDTKLVTSSFAVKGAPVPLKNKKP